MAVGADGSEEVCGNGQLLGELLRLGTHRATGACTQTGRAPNVRGRKKNSYSWCVNTERKWPASSYSQAALCQKFKASLFIPILMRCYKSHNKIKKLKYQTTNMEIKGAFKRCVEGSSLVSLQHVFEMKCLIIRLSLHENDSDCVCFVSG